MPPNAVEAGIKALRLHFLRETITGEVQANPAWLRYSDSPMRSNIQPNASIYMRRPVGAFDIAEFHPGPEDDTAEVSYHLQNWLTSGNDAAADGLLRASDGGMLNTHAMLARQSLISGGALGAGRRIYTVAKGGRISRVRLSGDPNTGEPVLVTLNYAFEKIRSYEIAQPSSSSVVSVVSTSTADTTQTVTVENEGAASSEGIALNGTTPVAGLTSFADIDSISLSAQTQGDVVISIGATEICRILGADSNGGYEGDLGIPPLGSGSFEGAIGTPLEAVVGSQITRGGSPLEANATVRTFEISVDNSLDIHPRIDSRRRRIIAGTRDITAVASIFSEAGSHSAFVDHIKTTQSDIVWTLIQGTVTVTGAALTGLGGRPYESGQAVMQRNNTFTGKGLTVA